jgi:arabinose-5-phosphate isomerase
MSDVGLVSPVDAAAVLATAKRVLRLEAEALAATESRLDEAFVEAVQLIRDARGRVVVSGIGKSGLIARKIAATLTSTGTPAVFVHPVEGLHGDLGIVGRHDVAVLLSKSGESAELSVFVEHLARLGVPVVALTGRPRSALGRAARLVIDCSVREEACPYDLAPTTSSTLALAVGDALAVALLHERGFTRDDFARLHPGGALGRRLTLRVRDVMLVEDLPSLPESATMRECVVLLAEKRGTVAILDDQRRLSGVVTSGDLTRLMERESEFFTVRVRDVMTRSPKVIEPDALAASAVFVMETHGIMALPVVAEDQRLHGMVHLHDLLRAGVV